MNPNSDGQNQGKEIPAGHRITRAEALERAARYVSQKMFNEAKVLDGAEAGPRIYLPVAAEPKDLRIVFKNRGEFAGIEFVRNCYRL
ncbi:MAG: hypothetical protein ACREFR_06570 [Limisphaerales bacterium]